MKLVERCVVSPWIVAWLPRSSCRCMCRRKRRRFSWHDTDVVLQPFIVKLKPSNPMSVSAISSSTGSSPVDWQIKAQQIKANFQALAQALQSGDLKSAQQAFATLQKDLPAKSSTATASSASSTNPNDLMNTVGQALQSGNLGAAQQAFAQLQQASHGRHHHRGAPAATTGAQGGPSASVTPANAGSSDAAGGMLNIVI